VPYYLVEEHTCEPYGGTERISYHVVVYGKDERQAFRAANQQSMRTRTRRGVIGSPPEPGEFFFSETELIEDITGYLWQAADGSDIWYEVRFLGTVTQMQVAPPEEQREGGSYERTSAGRLGSRK
jgi:hypothetical protein